ncbi:unnamed protein product [Discosporangium mesarthrocarpum]
MFNHTLPGAAVAAVGPGFISGPSRDRGDSNASWCAPPPLVGVPFPTPAYDQNIFYVTVGYLLGLAMTMVRE